ncbi:hypothetical protein TKK_0009268 [Trichogramma kaykai]|uniref:Ras-GEF domain-containing protein n=1 Tax=Trichogramma kaykai TaxID=54128 RepID=A0ABD2X1U3_9HYME
MEYERIRRLLRSEYKDFGRAGEQVLVESRFAETTRSGRGLRAVELGLTSNNLIVAADNFRDAKYWCSKDCDPSIESLELVSVYPLEFLSLSIFRRKRRKALKARLVDGRAKYYELGGPGLRRSAAWSRWCAQVANLLDRRCPSCTLSGTNVASGDSTSSKFECAHRRAATGGGGEKEVKRCAGGGAAGEDRRRPKRACNWTRDLFLGESHQELTNGSYTIVPFSFSNATLQEIKQAVDDSRGRLGRDSKRRQQRASHRGRCNVIFTRSVDRFHADERLLAEAAKSVSRCCCSAENKSSTSRDEDGRGLGCPDSSDLVASSRRDDDNNNDRRPRRRPRHRGSTSSPTARKNVEVAETVKAAAKLIHRRSRPGRLGVVDQRDKSRTRLEFPPDIAAGASAAARRYISVDTSPMINLIESGVSVWEKANKNNCDRSPHKLLRGYYGLSTATYFLYALGPWSVQPGDRPSVQCLERSHSCASIRCQPIDPDLRLPVSRRQLVTSVSLADLTGRETGLTASTRGKVVLFWTPNYWYRPRAATDAYREIRCHLDGLTDYTRTNESAATIDGRRKSTSRVIFGRARERRVEMFQISQTDSSQSSDRNVSETSRTNSEICRAPTKTCEPSVASTTAYLRHLLRLDRRVTLRDVDSATLASQLTLVDRELFLRVPRRELLTVAGRRSSRDAPNLGAWIAFAHRVSCLTASEVLAAGQVQTRARLCARLLSAADRCFEMGNFQSARSIVAGLQSPAIYRLRSTWAYLKAHHYPAYEQMIKLSTIFESTRTKKYRQTWTMAERNPPSMPFVGDILARLLGLERRQRIIARHNEARTISHKDVTKKHRRKNNKLERRSSSTSHRSGSTSTRKLLSENKLNCDEYRRVSALGSWLEQRQLSARSYNFPGQSLAWTFLLKARYREERDNFFASLQLEPAV